MSICIFFEVELTIFIDWFFLGNQTTFFQELLELMGCSPEERRRLRDWFYDHAEDAIRLNKEDFYDCMLAKLLEIRSVIAIANIGYKILDPSQDLDREIAGILGIPLKDLH